MAFRLGRTLAVRFAVTMGVALVAIVLWAYQGMIQILRDQIDQSLKTTYEVQASTLALQGSIFRLPKVDERRFVEINRLVVVRDVTGHIVQANAEQAMDLTLDSTAFRRALAGRTTTTEGRWRGREVRVLYGPTPAGTGASAVLEVAAFLAPLEAASRRVLFRMIATALAVLSRRWSAESKRGSAASSGWSMCRQKSAQYRNACSITREIQRSSEVR